MSALILSLLLTQAAATYSPEESRAIFAEGVEAYGRDDAASAEAAFKKLREHGVGGADVEYNLGTAALAQGKLGEAVLSLERARRAGGGPDVDANLAIARGRIVDQVVGAGGEETVLGRLVAATTSTGTALAFLVPWCAGFLLLLLLRWRGRAPSLHVGAVLLLVLSLPGAGLLAAHVYVRETVREAVVMARTVAVRETPDPASKVAFELHAGSGVRLLASSGTFVRLRLPNGLEGWAEQRDLARIDESAAP